MLKPNRVAIVGCGFTGTSALYQLVNRYPVKEIVVFEKRNAFGPGFPYQAEDCAHYRMNSPTDSLGVAPWNRRAFLEWLEAQPNVGPIDGNSYRSRADFGRFLQDIVRQSVRRARLKGIHVETVQQEVVGIREGDVNGITIECAARNYECDAAILATGRCPDIHVASKDENVRASYFSTHILAKELELIPLDATCHILGTSLSAIDVINRLFSPDTGCRFIQSEGGLTFEPGPNLRRVILCSRSGRLKKVESPKQHAIERTKLTWGNIERLVRDGNLTLASILALAREEAASHDVTIDWSNIFDPYRNCQSASDVTRRGKEILHDDVRRARNGGDANFLVDLVEDIKPLLWELFALHALAPAEERQYRDKVETALLSYSAPCPLPIAEKLLALFEAGRLELRLASGEVAPTADGAGYTIPHRFGMDIANVVINTTGRVDRRISSSRQSSLVASLRDRCLHKPYEVGGIESDGVSVDMSSFRATGSRAIYVANMFLWGPGFFTSSAFTMCSIVDKILRGLYGPQ